MSNLRTVILAAALCGIAMGQKRPKLTIDLDEISVSNKENDYFGVFKASVTHGSSPNTGSLTVVVKKDLPDNFMVRFIPKVSDKEFAPIEMPLCKAMIEESIGKPTVAQGEDPFPKSCPIEKGSYSIPKYEVNTEKLPSSLPSGEFTATVQLYMPDKAPIATMVVKGEIKNS